MLNGSAINLIALLRGIQDGESGLGTTEMDRQLDYAATRVIGGGNGKHKQSGQRQRRQRGRRPSHMPCIYACAVAERYARIL